MKTYIRSTSAFLSPQAQLDEQARLLAERGMVLVGNGSEEDSNDESVDEAEQEQRTRAIVSADTANILSGLGPGPLDVRVKRLAEERDNLQVAYLWLFCEHHHAKSSPCPCSGSGSTNETRPRRREEP